MLTSLLLTPMTESDWSAFEGAGPAIGHDAPLFYRGNVFVQTSDVFSDATPAEVIVGTNDDGIPVVAVAWQGVDENFVERRRVFPSSEHCNEAEALAIMIGKLQVLDAMSLKLLGLE